MLRYNKLLGSLIVFAMMSACESSPSTSNGNDSINSDTLNSHFKGKGVFWVTRLLPDPELKVTAYSQPDSNLSNFVPFDTLKNDSIIWPGMFGEGTINYMVCRVFTDTTSICGNIGDLEFVDSSLNLKEYKKIAIVFNIDSAISNLKVFLDKRRPNELLSVRKGFYQSAQDSNYISKTIRASKGTNTILFEDTSLPEGGSGYRLNFYISDSTDNFFTPTRYVCVNRARIILTK